MSDSLPGYASRLSQHEAEMRAGQERLKHHAANAELARRGAELKVVEEQDSAPKPQKGDDNVIMDGLGMSVGMPNAPLPHKVNPEAYVEALERARAENPEKATELSMAAPVTLKRRGGPKATSAEDVLAGLDELLADSK